MFVVRHAKFWVYFTVGTIYQYSDSRSLLKLYNLYISLVRPHLDYAAQVWDPHLQKDIKLLECAKFALKNNYVQSNRIKAMMDSLNCSLYLQWKTVAFF